jgi:hypothetical protein
VVIVDVVGWFDIVVDWLYLYLGAWIERWV